MRPKEFENQITRCVYADEEDFKYLKKRGIGITEFFRQAISKHKNKDWEFEYTKDE